MRKCKHGFSSRKGNRREYNSWIQMKTRCLNPKADKYSFYGGRGIRIHPEWVESFEAFITYMGSAPTQAHTIDRIDTNGHYVPGNVRWATRSEQQRNRRDNRTINVGGKCVCLAEAAELNGRNPQTLRGRIRKGWSVENALSEPPRHKGRGKKREDRTCSVAGCGRPFSSTGFCRMHHHRWLRHGDPLIVLLPPGRPKGSKNKWRAQA